MAVKAIAYISEVLAGTDSGTFKVRIDSVNLTDGSSTTWLLDNVSPAVLAATFQANLIASVKDQWGFSVLDGVRLIGSDIF